MAENDILFTGSIPANYDRYMVPLLFRPYAEQVAQRARILSPKRILETAAGTGIVTQALHEALPDADIVATDLNTPMLEEAERRVGSGKVLFRQADALALPFEDACFDLVVCQFGVMFFPDKVAGNSEAHRVLRDGGSYMLVIWNGVDRNLAFAGEIEETILLQSALDPLQLLLLPTHGGGGDNPGDGELELALFLVERRFG